MASLLRHGLMLALCVWADSVPEQRLATAFSCASEQGTHDERVIYADQGEFVLDGARIETFRWESTVHRRTHGLECSIDQGDGLQAQRLENGWRVSLVDAGKARAARGYDFAHGLECTLRLELRADVLRIAPNCPALCGSRENFSALTVNLNTGACRHE